MAMMALYVGLLNCRIGGRSVILFCENHNDRVVALAVGKVLGSCGYCGLQQVL